MKAIGLAVVGVALDLVYALLLALPVMWLTAFLHDYGSPLAPLSYLQSWWVAFLLAWILDGSGTVRHRHESIEVRS